MHKQFAHFACWMPNMRMALGDVGVLTHCRFEKVNTLAQLGVEFTADADSTAADIEYSSSGQVEVSTNADVDAPGLPGNRPTATVSITFARQGATFFQAAGCVWESMTNLAALECELRRLHEDRRWQLDWVVVTKVMRTGSAAIIVSDQKGATLELGVAVDGLTAPIPVATAAARLSVVAKSGLAASVLAPDGATPLFGAVGLRRTVRGAPRMNFRSSGPAPLGMASVTWEEFSGETTESQ